MGKRIWAWSRHSVGMADCSDDSPGRLDKAKILFGHLSLSTVASAVAVIAAVSNELPTQATRPLTSPDVPKLTFSLALFHATVAQAHES